MLSVICPTTGEQALYEGERQPGPDLSEKPAAEIRGIAKANGVTGVSKLRHPELAEKVSDAIADVIPIVLDYRTPIEDARIVCPVCGEVHRLDANTGVVQLSELT